MLTDWEAEVKYIRPELDIIFNYRKVKWTTKILEISHWNEKWADGRHGRLTSLKRKFVKCKLEPDGTRIWWEREKEMGEV